MKHVDTGDHPFEYEEPIKLTVGFVALASVVDADLASGGGTTRDKVWRHAIRGRRRYIGRDSMVQRPSPLSS